MSSLLAITFLASQVLLALLAWQGAVLYQTGIHNDWE